MPLMGKKILVTLCLTGSDLLLLSFIFTWQRDGGTERLCVDVGSEVYRLDLVR